MKKLCIIGAVLLVAGIVLCILGLAMGGFQKEDMVMSKLTDKTIEIAEDFTNIRIDTNTTDVMVSLSQDGSCHILCRETQLQPHTARAENGTLILQQENYRKWYHYISINRGTPRVEIQLPKEEYESFTMEGNTGDVVIPKEFSFNNVKIDCSTGQVDVQSQVKKTLAIELSTGDILVSGVSCERLEVRTSTGDIRILDVNCKDLTGESNTGGQLLENVQATENIQLSCSTGGIHFTRGSCRNLTVETSSGKQIMESVVASGDVRMESKTGDIRLTDFDGATISLSTTTGNVTGTVLSEKIFLAQTNTGRVEVPRCTSGGTCEITTDTGDIIIQLA